MKLFKDRVVLITGAGSGIGRAASVAFAGEGALVAISDADTKRGREVAAEIGENGGTAMFVKADVRVAAEVAAMVQETTDSFGGLDIAFNNAGLGGGDYVPLHEYPEKTYDLVMDVNLRGVYLSMKYEIPALIERGGGCIVNTSSVNGLVGAKCGATYAAAKHAVIGMSKSVAVEMAAHGIRVNTLCPGLTDTDFHKGKQAGWQDHVMPLIPLKRLATPQEMADALLWMCSDAASYVTGHDLVVDGGFLLRE